MLYFVDVVEFTESQLTLTCSYKNHSVWFDIMQKKYLGILFNGCAGILSLGDVKETLNYLR